VTIYTRRGDHGQTSLGDGTRTNKASTRVEAYGTVDEAGAAVGFALAAIGDEDLSGVLTFAQNKLFDCASALANPAVADSGVTGADTAFLEHAVDRFTDECGEFRGFVLASGGEAATRLHLARTVARRAERRVDALAAESPVDPAVLCFLNRLSDLLFAAARCAACRSDAPEHLWEKNAEPPTL
jgi:cob(I)alamin adenosyltransferase